MNRARPTLVLPELASLSVKLAPVDSRLIQLERGTCHTLWHHLDLDFVSDDSNAGRLSAYTALAASARSTWWWRSWSDAKATKPTGGRKRTSSCSCL